MIVFCDNIKFAEEFLHSSLNWEITDNKNPDFLTFLFKELFINKFLYQAEISGFEPWEYLFICKESEKSQFDVLVEFSKQNFKEPGKLLCIAGSGRNFHGFRNRNWESLAGNLHLSVYIRPDREIRNFHSGILAASAVALVQAIDSFPELKGNAKIKWINDILIDGAKVSGIITRAQTQGNVVTGTVIGIGMNIFANPCIKSDSIIPKATCLSEFVRKEKISLNKVFILVTKQLNLQYENLVIDLFENVLNFYTSRSLIVGEKVRVLSDPVSGKPEEIYEGTVERIGLNLELYFKDKLQPVTKGRLII